MASGHSKGHHEVQNDSTNSNEVGFDSEEDKINKLSTRVSPPHLKQNETKKQSASEKKKTTFFGKLMGTVLFHPDSAEVPDSKLQELRDRIHETHEAEKIKKQVKQRKRAMKLMRLESIKHSKDAKQTNLIHINEVGGLANKSRQSMFRPKPNSISSGRGNSSGARSWNSLNLNNAHGPTHVAAFANDKEEEWLAKRKKISQLYTGLGVYSHAVSNLYDTPSTSRFYTLLNEEKRLKYPISYDIKLKIERIKHKREKRKPKKSCACCEWIKRKFFQTAFGNVFRVTPRYYKMTPEVPKFCRRCKYPLEDTLESRWTPAGVTFFILFPIIGILCCLANREFVCVVCEEIYVYGDFPSRCRPAETLKHDDVFNLSERKRSFKSYMNMHQDDDQPSEEY